MELFQRRRSDVESETNEVAKVNREQVREVIDRRTALNVAAHDPMLVDQVVCDVCYGEKFLWMYSEEFPDEPPTRVVCCSCTGIGRISMLNVKID